jgi:hypothetical protein
MNPIARGLAPLALLAPVVVSGCELGEYVGVVPGLSITRGSLAAELPAAPGAMTEVAFTPDPDQSSLGLAGSLVTSAPGRYTLTLTGTASANISVNKVGIALQAAEPPPAAFSAQTNLGLKAPITSGDTVAFLGLLWPTRAETDPVSVNLEFPGAPPQRLALKVQVVGNRVTPRTRNPPEGKDEAACPEHNFVQRRSCEGSSWTFYTFCTPTGRGVCDCNEMLDVTYLPRCAQ